MIEIKMTGMCDGCTNADLEAVSLHYTDNRGKPCRTWTITCAHQLACEAAVERANQEVET